MCQWEVSSHANISSRRRVSSTDLSSGSVFARPRVFNTPHGFTPGSVLATAMCSGSVYGRSRVLAVRSVFAGNVSPNTHMSSLSSTVMRLPMPRCLRRPFFGTLVLDPCVFKMCRRSWGNICNPRRPQCTFIQI